MSDVNQPLVAVEDLVKHFRQSSGVGGRNGVVRAVEKVSLSLAVGETLGLVGESGSGKSTTGRLMLRLIEPTSGKCIFGGKNIYTLPKREMRSLRKEMQIIFQDPYGAFNPRMTIGRIIGEGLELRGVTSRTERESEISRLLELTQLPADVRNRYPHEFSGGQRQRLGIARALAVEPRFLVADEPCSALDVSTQAEIVNLLLDLQQRLGLTMLFISHDLSVVRVLADRIAVMFAGRILETANSQALFDNSLQPYTQELLAAIPEPDPAKAHREPRKQFVQANEDSSAGSSADGCPFAGRCPHTMDICRATMPPLVDYGPLLGESTRHDAACHWTAQEFAGKREQAGDRNPMSTQAG